MIKGINISAQYVRSADHIAQLLLMKIIILFLAAGAVLFSLSSSPVVYADGDLVRRMCEQFRDDSGEEGGGTLEEDCKACLYGKPKSDEADVCGLTEMLFNCATSALDSARQVSARLIDDDDDDPADDHPRRKPLEDCFVLFRTSLELMHNTYPLFQRYSWDYELGRARVRNARALGFQGCLAAFESAGNVTHVPPELLDPMTHFDRLCQDIWLVTEDLRFSYKILCSHQTRRYMMLISAALPPV